MSDAMASTVLVRSWDGDGVEVVPQAAPAAAERALHVDGGAHAEPALPGLNVEFRSLGDAARLRPPDGPAPVSVSGAAATLPDQPSDIVAGALHGGP